MDIVKGGEASTADTNQLRQAVETFSSSIHDFHMAPFFLFKYLPSKVVNDMNKAYDIMLQVGMKHCNAYLGKLRNSGNTEIFHGQPLLEQWLIEGKLTETNAIKSAAEMLIAGVDTVSTITILHSSC